MGRLQRFLSPICKVFNCKQHTTHIQATSPAGSGRRMSCKPSFVQDALCGCVLCVPLQVTFLEGASGLLAAQALLAHMTGDHSTKDDKIRVRCRYCSCMPCCRKAGCDPFCTVLPSLLMLCGSKVSCRFCKS
jgi:hypothetical protein